MKWCRASGMMRANFGSADAVHTYVLTRAGVCLAEGRAATAVGWRRGCAVETAPARRTTTILRPSARVAVAAAAGSQCRSGLRRRRRGVTGGRRRRPRSAGLRRRFRPNFRGFGCDLFGVACQCQAYSLVQCVLLSSSEQVSAFRTGKVDGDSSSGSRRRMRRLAPPGSPASPEPGPRKIGPRAPRRPAVPATARTGPPAVKVTVVLWHRRARAGHARPGRVGPTIARLGLRRSAHYHRWPSRD